MAVKNITIETVTSELYRSYDIINKHFFNSELPVIAITIQSDNRRTTTMGWCTTKEVWGDKKGKIKMYEINLTPEFLDYDFYETMDTLMHEMVHLYNKIKGVKDTSRNNTYHNKNFKNESIKRGFYYKEDKPNAQYGWSFSRLTDETKKKLDTLGIKKEIFTIARKTGNYFTNIEMGIDPSEEETKKKGNSYKWVCPSCQAIVRSTKSEMNIICGDCEEEFLLDEE